MSEISPFADQMISLLPPLWAQAGEEYLMKQSVLGILSALVTSMMGDSQKYHPLIISLVSSSVDVASNTRVYLLEDALDLWSNILVETPTPASLEIINLAQHLFPLYDSASENLRKALEITELYIFLIPQHFLSESSRLLGPFASLLDTTKREAAGLVINLVELLIRSADSLGGLEAIAHLTTSMISTNFLPTILKGLKTAYSAHQTTGPNHVSSSIDGVVETDYLSFLSRLALASPSLFVSALAAAMPSASFDEIISWLLTEWFSHFDNISYPEKKKLSCLALTALLETNEPWILSRLQELMTVWTDSIIDLVEADDGGTDCLVYRNEELLKGDWRESPADERRRKLKFLDPVHRLNIKTFVKERLEAAVLRAGGMEVFERMWVVNVDKDVLRGFGELNVV